jgi:hypothetical protein
LSNTDSFIEEVAEEVRRDSWFRFLKRWGWVGFVLVIALVGGSSFNEWNKRSIETAGQLFGDSILVSTKQNDTGVELENIKTDNKRQKIIIANLSASRAVSENRLDDSIKTLTDIVNLSEIPAVYQELAAFKLALLLKDRGLKTLEERFEAFENLSVQGSAFRQLAREQQAIILVEQGKLEMAIKILDELSEEAGVSEGLKRRISQLLIVLNSSVKGQ